MPRYGAKTYSGKRKDDTNSQFDEIWAKSQGSKAPSHQFTPVKESPARASRTTNSVAVEPARHYQTRSSPGKNQPSRRTRSNSSAEDPFSFGKDDELAKSPVRKSPRMTRNSSTEVKPSVGVKRNLTAKSVKLSASNSESDPKGKKQSSIFKYTAKAPANSVKEVSEVNTVEPSVEKSKTELSVDGHTANQHGATSSDTSKNNGGSRIGLFTDGFGSPPAVSGSKSVQNGPDTGLFTDGFGSPPATVSNRRTSTTTQGLHSYAISPVRLQTEMTVEHDEGDLPLIKRKCRTNGNVIKPSEPPKAEPKKPSAVVSKEAKPPAASNHLPKVTVGAKDEFDFDEDFSDTSRENSPVVKAKEVTTGLLKKRSKEITGVTRRIFNSPKKSPMKARYNARSWAKSDSEDLDQDSLVDEEDTESQSEASTSSLSQQSTSKPALTRTVKQSLQKPNHSTVTSLKCKKQDKKFFTVVKHVKQAHQCQESGESQQYSDDIEYLLDGLNSNAGSATKCLSTISLIEKSTVPSFRMHLRAHNTISRIFTALQNAAEDPCMALCTSGLMYMLSKDRLNMDLDRSSLTLLVRLLSVEGEGTTQEEREEFAKTRARLWGIIKNTPGQMFGVTEHTLCSGFFAMESLLALTSKRSGEWFKEELRFAGGLENMANTVAKVTEAVTSTNEDPTQIELVPLRTLNRCVRVLENVTFMNTDNQQYLLELSDLKLIRSLARTLNHCVRVLENVTFMNTDNQQYLLELSDLKLIRSLASFLSLCEKHIELCPTEPQDPNSPEANLSKLVIQGLLANLRLLLNLTHDNEWGSMKIGEQAGLMYTVLQCVLQLPQFIPKDQRFDLLVLSLGLLINLVEHNVTNARILTMMKTNHSYDSQPDTEQDEVSSINALTELFLQRHQAAVKLENQTEHDADDDEIPPDADIDDWVTIETEPNNSGRDQPTQEEIKNSIKRALHTAGRHMEDSIVASYAALLLGCLLRENKLNVKKVRDCLPNGDFSIMVLMLKKLLSFMELTDADGSTGQKSISKVIEVLECC